MDDSTKSTHRCPWPGTDPLYVAYHDTEWGVPEYDARALWEKLVLDGMQAGLAWITILRKRDGIRDAFDGFDPHKVAAYTEADVERLLADPRIIRSRAKINSAIKGARLWLEIQETARAAKGRTSLNGCGASSAAHPSRTPGPASATPRPRAPNP